MEIRDRAGASGFRTTIPGTPMESTRPGRAAGASLVLVGRDRECARIDELLEGTLAGESGALIVRGEAGIGKSALLDYAAARADGMQLLTTAGVEAEADLAFAGLYGLLRPILDRLSELPELQANALAGALGLAPSTGSERFLVSAAVLGLLAEAAEERPVLCLVEDAHWLDTPSAEALVFAARRLRAERVAIVFAVREGEARTFEGRGLPELLVSGLEDEDARALLSDSLDEVAWSVRERVLVEAAGNPLALLELPAGLSEEQRAGIEPLPDAIPLTARVQATFAARLEGLPAATQTALLIAAVDDTGDVAAVVRAAAELGVSPEALEAAEASGIVRTAGGRIAFRHPLVRAAVLDAATLAQRQRTHAALASVLDGEEHADRRVWHHALATLTADENVAAALEAAGRRSRLRGGQASAATAFERAAALSDAEPSRSRRLGEAAEAAWAAGQAERARGLVTRSLPHADGGQRVRLLYLSGVIKARSGWLPDALAPLLQAIQESEDASLTLEMLYDGYEFATYAEAHDQLAELARRAAEVEPATETDRFLAAALKTWGSELSGDHARAALLAAEAIERAARLDDPRCLILAAVTADREGSWGDGLPHANRAVALARERGLLSVLPQTLAAQSTELIGRSRFELGYSAAEEGSHLALDIGQPWIAAWNGCNLATVEALRGQEDNTRGRVDAIQQLTATSGASFTILGERVLGLLDLTLGRPADALEHLRRYAAAPAGVLMTPHRVTQLPDVVEAAARAHELDEAAERLARLQAWVEQFPTPARLSLLARCQAVAAESDAEPHFERSIELAEALSPFERARSELLYGEWLRRERRRVDARPHLRAALELLQRLALPPWEERARAELRASGETARRRDPSTRDQLTPQELQIAHLVAEGMTNREIGAQLFLSPRTIDYHLRKVFAKLEIASRADLARIDLGEHASA
jgi:DNA-binding CsgD family transcriptional regulator/tetratricopeptide (TPR) repeat protein